MADLKISQLSAATALAGTEVVPVVQSGATKKATIDQILAPAAGKGIDFSAAGGDVLKMYDEGVWTPTLNSFTGGTLTAAGHYTRIGRAVYLTIYVTNAGGGFSTTAGVSSITNLPFAPNTTISNFATVTNGNAATIGAQNQAGIVNSGGGGTIYPPTFVNLGTEPESICCWYFV